MLGQRRGVQGKFAHNRSIPGDALHQIPVGGGVTPFHAAAENSNGAPLCIKGAAMRCSIYAQSHPADHGKTGTNEIPRQAGSHLLAIKGAAPAAYDSQSQVILFLPFTAAVKQRRRLGDLPEQGGVARRIQ